jgi:hypothetical protein
VSPCSGITFALLSSALVVGAQTKPAADAWIADPVLYPAGIVTNALRPDGFTALAAEHLAEQLKVRWLSPAPATPDPVVLYYSADAPGHWPARDWRTVPMARRGKTWEATLPVTEVDVPLVYFVSDGTKAPAILSPMRVVSPRQAGMEQPSRVFWPFLDGFEEGLDGWLLVTPDAPALKSSPQAHDGNASLAVSLPAGKPSVEVCTPRVRGWHYSLQLATGMRVWLRAPGGAGEARFTLHAQAGTAHAVTVASTITATLNDKWQRVDLAFSSFPNFPVASADTFSIEFRGDGPREFLVDDLQLLGRWKVPGN